MSYRCGQAVLAHLGNDALAMVDVALMLVYLPIFSSTITF